MEHIFNNPPLFVQYIFVNLEHLAMLLMFIKIISNCIFYKKKYKSRLSTSFWFYIFFIMAYEVCTLLSLKSFFLGPLTNKSLIMYFKNLIFTGSLIFLQIYLFQVGTASSKNLGAGNILKIQKKIKLCTNTVYILTTFNTLLQSVMVAFAPYMLIKADFHVESISTVCILLTLITAIIIYHNCISFKKIIFRWMFYLILVTLIVPYSSLLDSIQNKVLYRNEFGALIMLLARGPFIGLRAIQIVLLWINAIKRDEMRALYD